MLKSFHVRFNSSTKLQNQPGDELNSAGKLPLYGPLNVTDIDAFLHRAKENFMATYANPSLNYSVNRNDFDLISVLGKGAFGKVLLVKGKYRNPNTFYAMKALEKSHISKMKQVKNLLNEKRILECIDSPFVVRMEYFSKDNCYIYFFMPFISGGEMFNYLQKVGHFSESASMFYAAQVVLALEYLHHLNLVYRDLKPENILFDHFGYLKITDFGFTKPILTRTYTFCGTPHYLAPEVISGHGYGYSVDWWSLGVLIFEMNMGYPPFDAKDQMVMFKLILQSRYKMPEQLNDTLKNVIEVLLQTDVTRRLGNLKGGSEDVKNHEWFKPINWLEVFNRRMPAPYIPPVSGHGDISNYITNENKKASFLKQISTDEFEEQFKDF